MSMLDRMKEIGNKATVKAFKLGEEADTLGRKAAKLDKKPDKTKQEEAQMRELRKEAARMREQQQQAKQLSQGMGLGGKILRCYFAYKMASLFCHTLVGLAGGYAYNQHGNAIGHAVTEGIDQAADKIADNIMEQTNNSEGQDINEQRAQMIEQTLDSFERMNQQAQEQGLTSENEPLLTDEDKQKIQELADISRDTENEQQAEQYAAKCQELGLDYNEAKTAFEQDKTFDTVQNEVEKQQEKEAQSQGIEIEYEV